MAFRWVLSLPLCQRGTGRKGGAVSQDPTWGKGKTQEVTQGLWGRQVACGAPGQTLGELPEGEGPLPRGGQGTPSWLFLPTVFPTNPSPPYHRAACPLTHTPSHQLSQFLAPVHPLYPGGLITSDPRRWIRPFSCLSPVPLPLPSSPQGRRARATRG